MQIVVGVDQCEDGWVFIRLADGKFESARFYEKFADGVEISSDAKAIGVDIPIGYPHAEAIKVDTPIGVPHPPAERRSADTDARAMVGPRRSSVFSALPPILLDQPIWEAANQESIRLYDGRGVSKQSFALKPKIIEVAAVAEGNNRVYEVHPEVSFAKLAGHRHLAFSKYKWNGHHVRRKLLEDHGIVIPYNSLDEVRTAGVDDVLDAAAAAWSARRIALKQAVALPRAVKEYDVSGRRVAIWY